MARHPDVAPDRLTAPALSSDLVACCRGVMRSSVTPAALQNRMLCCLQVRGLPLWSEHQCFETQTSWEKKVCECSFLNNGLFCILGHASSTAPTMLVGRLVGPPRWRSLDKNYSMVGHDIFLSDIMSLAPRRIKTTDLGGPVKATPREMC